MNKEELEKVEQLIEQKDSEQLKDLLAGLHPADVAELCNELDAEEARMMPWTLSVKWTRTNKKKSSHTLKT